MSRLYLRLVLSILCASQLSWGEEPAVIQPIEDKQAAEAALQMAETAVQMSDAGGIIYDVKFDLSAQYQSVVKVETASLTPNYAMPWLPGDYRGGRGTAFLIGKNLFLTNAHVVSDARELYISKYGESRKIPAQVIHIAHDCDLALLKVSDYTPFEKMKPFEIGELPKLEDEVRALGYPVGGERLSVTRGVVSRIDTINYSHTGSDVHLVIQIDAAINPGNSGGPVLMGNNVIGVAFQGMTDADNTGYVIPAPVIKHFLKDVEDGKYDGYVGLGVMEFAILNSAMRTHLGLPDDEKGVLVIETFRSGPAYGVLQPGDVILKLDGREVDSSGKIELDGETVNMNELVERKFAGDKVKVVFLRDRAPMEAEITLSPVSSKKILSASYDERPQYVLFGGLLFQPGNRNVFYAHKLNFPQQNVEVEDFVIKGGGEEKKDFVILTTVLPDEVNENLGTVRPGIVKKINGTEVKGIQHLYELLHPAQKPEFFIIELAGMARPIVFDAATIDAANARIARQYNVTREHYLN